MNNRQLTQAGVQRSNGRRSGQRFLGGMMTVEAALLFPIVMLLTFGVIEYGWMFLKHQQVTNAARQAARLAAMVDATNAQVTTSVTNMMSNYGLGSSGYTTTIAAGTNNNVSQARGTLISVTVSVPYANIDITKMTTFLPMPSTISAKVTMEKEGP